MSDEWFLSEFYSIYYLATILKSIHYTLYYIYYGYGLRLHTKNMKRMKNKLNIENQNIKNLELKQTT